MSVQFDYQTNSLHTKMLCSASKSPLNFRDSTVETLQKQNSTISICNHTNPP